MPTLTILVENIPDGSHLALQTKTGYVDGDGPRFTVPYDLRDGKPTGPAVQRQPDGRRFAYLAWLQNGTMVGRIKIQFDALPPERLAEDNTVTISATNPKGKPAGGSVPIEI